jgi:hypothetical protein
LGIGLGNHRRSYYWAGMGIGARRLNQLTEFTFGQEHVVKFLRRRERCTTSTVVEARELQKIRPANFNDAGKRSEWAAFDTVGDTVQLVPEDAASEVIVKNSPFSTFMLGVRRSGRPVGADPIVEKVWIRSESTDDARMGRGVARHNSHIVSI